MVHSALAGGARHPLLLALRGQGGYRQRILKAAVPPDPLAGAFLAFGARRKTGGANRMASDNTAKETDLYVR